MNQNLTESAIRVKLCQAKVFETRSQLAMLEINGANQMLVGMSQAASPELQFAVLEHRIKCLEGLEKMNDGEAFDAIRLAFGEWLDTPTITNRILFEAALYANRTNFENWMMRLEEISKEAE